MSNASSTDLSTAASFQHSSPSGFTASDLDGAEDVQAGIKESLEVADFFETLTVGLVTRVRGGISPFDAISLVLDEDVRADGLAAVQGIKDVPGEIFGVAPAELSALVGRFEGAGFKIVGAFVSDADGEETAGIKEIMDVIDFAESFAYYVLGEVADGVSLSDAVELARDAALREDALEAVAGATRLPIEAADLSLAEIEQLTGRLREIGFGIYETVLAERNVEG